ncbi:MAG: malonate transporter subunit MadL [Planctomycetota bacterium]
MAASQNVMAALNGGVAAAAAGLGAVAIAFAAVPFVTKLGGNADTDDGAFEPTTDA